MVYQPEGLNVKITRVPLILSLSVLITNLFWSLCFRIPWQLRVCPCQPLPSTCRKKGKPTTNTFTIHLVNSGRHNNKKPNFISMVFKIKRPSFHLTIT